jgi:hypothetical protein
MNRISACAIAALALAGTPAAAQKSPITPPDFAAAFNAEDLNHDGQLGWDEFLAAGKEREGRKHADAARNSSFRWVFHFVERFAQMDLDDDEFLTRDEYSRGRLRNEDNAGNLRYIQPNPPLPKAAPVVKKQLPLTHPEIGPSPKSHEDTFEVSDTNHDGKLTWEEYFTRRQYQEGLDHGDDARRPDYFWMRHYVERFMLMDYNADEVLTLDEYVRGHLLNTYNDNTFRFALPKAYAKWPTQ